MHFQRTIYLQLTPVRAFARKLLARLFSGKRSVLGFLVFFHRRLARALETLTPLTNPIDPVLLLKNLVVAHCKSLTSDLSLVIFFSFTGAQRVFETH